MKRKTSKTERKFMFKFIFAGIGGMIAGAIALFFFHKLLGWSIDSSKTAVIALPWMITGAILIPAAYKQGFKDGNRNFTNQELEYKEKTPE